MVSRADINSVINETKPRNSIVSGLTKEEYSESSNLHKVRSQLEMIRIN